MGVATSMRKLVLPLLAIGYIAISLPCPHALATDPPLVADPEVVRFIVVLGRIQIDPTSYKITQFHRNDPDKNQEVELNLSLVKKLPCLRVIRRDDKERTRLAIDHNGCMRMEWDSGEGSRSLTIDQTSPQSLRRELTVRATKNEKLDWEWSGANLWVLWEQEAERAERDVLPVLHRLNPSWDFSATLNEAKKRSLWVSDSLGATEWDQILHDIGSTDSQTQTRATNRIHALGLSALPWIESSLARSELPYLERRILLRARESLQPSSEDTPTRIALSIDLVSKRH